LDEIVLEESYVLGFLRRAKDVVITMEFLSVGNKVNTGELVFPDVLAEEWHTTLGKTTSLEEIRIKTPRSRGGPDEPSDFGSINVIRYQDGFWELFADWGDCRLRLSKTPFVLINASLDLSCGEPKQE
jgi:hypothetical protein